MLNANGSCARANGLININCRRGGLRAATLCTLRVGPIQAETDRRMWIKRLKEYTGNVRCRIIVVDRAFFRVVRNSVNLTLNHEAKPARCANLKLRPQREMEGQQGGRVDGPVPAQPRRMTFNPGHGAAKCNSAESKHPDEIVFSGHVARTERSQLCAL